MPAGQQLETLAAELDDECRPAGPSPRSIETAPQHLNRTLLLYCASEGGWHIGEWVGGRWVDASTLEVLHPSHWAALPDEPD
jgi:hypothetical protein